MITVTEQCIKCYRCVKACPSMIIELDENGIPKSVKDSDKRCIKCGHCVAVCPKEAIDNTLTPLVEQGVINNGLTVTPKASKQFLRSVRSIRNYKSDGVDDDLMVNIVSVGRYAPTARNTQGVSFLAVMDRAKVSALAEMVIAWMEKMVAAGVTELKPYAGVARAHRAGKDMIFRGAPHLVIALAPKSNSYGVENARMMMVYTRIQATAVGLGTCWAGFFEIYAKHNADEVAAFLGLSDDVEVGAAIMVGYPQFDYHRLVARDNLNIRFL